MSLDLIHSQSIQFSNILVRQSFLKKRSRELEFQNLFSMLNNKKGNKNQSKISPGGLMLNDNFSLNESMTGSGIKSMSSAIEPMESVADQFLGGSTNLLMKILQDSKPAMRQPNE